MIRILKRDGDLLRECPDLDTLRGANLSRADLRGANLSRTSLCRATIDGAIVETSGIGGPGHILYALTDEEARQIAAQRGEA